MDVNCSRASILRLPEELLDNIVQEACRIDNETMCDDGLSDYWEQRRKYWVERLRTPASLCLVCRRLNRIAMPYLYADLATGDTRAVDIEAMVPSPKLLHRSCRRNPDLWRLCRSLTVYYDGCTHPRDPLGYIANDLTAWLTETRLFSLSSSWEDPEDAWRVCLQGMSNFKHLEELSLRATPASGINVARLFGALNEMGCSKLRTLELDGLSPCVDDGGKKRPGLEPGTASLTTLRLHNFFVKPPLLEELMRWTPSLEHFRLDTTYHDYCYIPFHTGPWSLATLQSILAIHRTTLRSIDISTIDCPGLSGFDMRPFERLEELRLTHCTMFGTGEVAVVDSQNIVLLLAPRLRFFHFDLIFDDKLGRKELDSFGAAEQNWLRVFAQMAVEQNCPLQEIKIEFCPPPTFRSVGHCNTCIYPWDRMDALGRELAPEGIQVRYNPPNLSRDDWAGALKARCDCEGHRLCFACSGRREDVTEVPVY